MRTAIVTSIVVLCLVACSGCNVLGYAATAVSGDPKYEAKFVPAKKPLVVIAENFASPALAAMDAEPLTRYISDELTTHDVATIVGADQVLSMQSENPKRYRGMTIASVGRTVGAEQILYVNIIDVNAHFADSSDMIKGHGEVRVRLVDANTGSTIWPTDGTDGFPVTTDTGIVRRDERNETLLRSDVHRALATRVARLFYTIKGE